LCKPVPILGFAYPPVGVPDALTLAARSVAPLLFVLPLPFN